MKRFGLLFSALFICAAFQAQETFYERVKASILEKYPQTELSGKILLVNILSDEFETRESVKSADHVAGIYKVAKLRGGPDGVVSVAVTRKIQESAATIAIRNDGVSHTLLVDGSAMENELRNAPQNVVYDSNGKEIYRNLPPAAIFNSILQLITR